MVPLFFSGTGRKTVVHLGSLDASSTGLLHRDLRTEFCLVFEFEIPAQSSLSSFEIPHCKAPPLLCLGITKVVAFGIGGAQINTSLMRHSGTRGTPRIRKRGGGEIPACPVAVPDSVF
jgi:hypothetical protein